YYSVGYEVEDYHVEGGFPVADTALGVGIPVEVDTGKMFASMTVGEVFSANTGNPISRWLPVAGCLDDPSQWQATPYPTDPDDPPAQPQRGFPLSTEGTTPEL